MATIKDIARLSGVSQGTVSNVLNGKGIVSSEKIRLVEAAAARLGYAVNERARLLRQGKSRIIAVILPSVRFKQYVDFYRSFTSFAENRGYSSLLYLSDDDPEIERKLVTQARSSMARAIVTFSSSASMHGEYREAGFEDPETLFVEREPAQPGNFIGFDYGACGRSMAEFAVAAGYRTVALVTDNVGFSNERSLLSAFMDTLGDTTRTGMGVRHVQTDMFRANQSAMQLFETGCPQAVFVSNYGFAETFRDVLKTFFGHAETKICTVSPLFTMPEADFLKYELNYRLMGKRAAETLISRIGHRAAGHRVILKNSGFRSWEASVPSSFHTETGTDPSRGGATRETPPPGAHAASAAHAAHAAPVLHVAPGVSAASGMSPARHDPPSLNVLTLDSPEASALKYLALLYTRSTGVPVNISVSSYDEMHEIVAGMDESSVYDVIRLDVTWLSWFAGRILLPLEDISPSLRPSPETFLDGISRQYFYVRDTLYALPFSPSAQVLFYRRDLFESTVIKRLYQETYRKALSPPATFEDYNRIARFFTRSFNPQSPVEYGTTVTLGSTGVAGTEFLTRYFAKTRRLFDESGRILLGTGEAKASLEELVEARCYAKPRPCPWWTHAAQEFSEGTVAMTILYSNFASEIVNRNSRVVNRIGYAPVPGGSPLVGGGSLGVSRFSRHPGLALSFIQWLGSEPISSATMFLGSVSACRKSYENYEIIDSYPWLELAKDCFALSANKRTPYDDFSPFDERRFLGILGLEVKNAYNGVVSAAGALEKVVRAYERQFTS